METHYIEPHTKASPSCISKYPLSPILDVLRVRFTALGVDARRQKLSEERQRLLPTGMAVTNVAVDDFIEGVVTFALRKEERSEAVLISIGIH